MNANRLPAAATLAQSIVPCQWLTSMPSTYVVDLGGGGSPASAARPRAAYSAGTPKMDETLRLPILRDPVPAVPELGPPQSVVQFPPGTVPDALTRTPSASLSLLGRGLAGAGAEAHAVAGGLERHVDDVEQASGGVDAPRAVERLRALAVDADDLVPAVALVGRARRTSCATCRPTTVSTATTLALLPMRPSRSAVVLGLAAQRDAVALGVEGRAAERGRRGDRRAARASAVAAITAATSDTRVRARRLTGRCRWAPDAWPPWWATGTRPWGWRWSQTRCTSLGDALRVAYRVKPGAIPRSGQVGPPHGAMHDRPQGGPRSGVGARAGVARRQPLPAVHLGVHGRRQPLAPDAREQVGGRHRRHPPPGRLRRRRDVGHDDAVVQRRPAGGRRGAAPGPSRPARQPGSRRTAAPRRGRRCRSRVRGRCSR